MKALHSARGTGIGYNPGVTYRGGEFIAAGIAQAGNALAEGIEKFQKNREERDFLDQGMKSRVAGLRQFQDYEKTANEDDTSPAGQLLKTFADWDNKSLSAKKAALMDADLLISKGEQAQRRAEDLQWRMLGEQRAQELLGLQREQFGEERRAARFREDLAWRNLMDNSRQRGLENLRADRADLRADRQLALSEGTFSLNQQLGQFNLGQAQTKAQQALADRAAMGRLLQFNQPVEVGPMPTIGFNAARAASETGGIVSLEDMANLEKLGRVSRAGTMTPIQGDPSGAMSYWQTDSSAFRVPAGGSQGASMEVSDWIKLNDSRSKLLAEFAIATPAMQRILGPQIQKLDAMLAANEPAGARPAAAPAPPGPARPTTQAEFDALPSGTLFVNPANGQTMRKK